MDIVLLEWAGETALAFTAGTNERWEPFSLFYFALSLHGALPVYYLVGYSVSFKSFESFRYVSALLTALYVPEFRGHLNLPNTCPRSVPIFISEVSCGLIFIEEPWLGTPRPTPPHKPIECSLGLESRVTMGRQAKIRTPGFDCSTLRNPSLLPAKKYDRQDMQNPPGTRLTCEGFFRHRLIIVPYSY